MPTNKARAATQIVSLLSLMLASMGSAFAQPQTPPQTPPVYRPPQTTQTLPPIRVGGPSRGCQRQPGAQDTRSGVNVLAPARFGLTSSATPVVYWRSNSDILPGTIVRIIIDDIDREATFFRAEFASGFKSGTHGFTLRALPSALAANVRYSFSVVVVCDPAKPSSNLLARGGMIFSPTSLKPPQGCTGACLGTFWASNGYWFDAVDVLSTQGTDPQAGAVLTRLLQDEGL